MPQDAVFSGWTSTGCASIAPNRVRDVFTEPIYDVAYQLGAAWADEIYQAWQALAVPMPEQWPFSKTEAKLVVLRLPPDSDPTMAKRLAAITHAAARVRWIRLRGRPATDRRAALRPQLQMQLGFDSFT